MSNLSSNTEHPQTLPPSSHRDLEERLLNLRETLDALLAECRGVSGSVAPDCPASLPDRDGETRSYYFPASVAHRERELLRENRVDNFPDLLARTHILLEGVVKVMQGVHPNARLKGYTLVSMGILLGQVCSLLLRIRNLYGQVERIEP